MRGTRRRATTARKTRSVRKKPCLYLTTSYVKSRCPGISMFDGRSTSMTSFSQPALTLHPAPSSTGTTPRTALARPQRARQHVGLERRHSAAGVVVALAPHERDVELRVERLEVARGRARIDLDPVVFAVRPRDIAVEAHRDRVSNASHGPLLPRRALAAARFGLLLRSRSLAAPRFFRSLARGREDLREVPPVPFEILGAIAARAVGRVLRLLD